MLGHKLVQQFSNDFDVWTTIRRPYADVERFGIFDRDRTIENAILENDADLERLLETVRPDAVVNAVGIIKQVPSSKDLISTLTVNSILPHRLNEFSSRLGFRLICVGTDCVFSGEKGNYSEEDRADAYDLYGRSKNLGEVTEGNSITIRTSIIGRELETSHSMVEWFLSNRGKKVNGYVNAIYTGFPTIVIADIIADLLTKHADLTGLFHVSSEAINKFELLEMINRRYNAGIDVARYEDFSIDRSLDSSRFREATGFVPLPWEEMVDRMAADRTPYEAFRK